MSSRVLGVVTETEEQVLGVLEERRYPDERGRQRRDRQLESYDVVDVIDVIFRESVSENEFFRGLASVVVEYLMS